MPISWRIFQFVVIHIFKDFGVVNKTEIDFFSGTVFLFDDPANVDNFSSLHQIFIDLKVQIFIKVLKFILRNLIEFFQMVNGFILLFSVVHLTLHR